MIQAENTTTKLALQLRDLQKSTTKKFRTTFTDLSV